MAEPADHATEPAAGRAVDRADVQNSAALTRSSRDPEEILPRLEEWLTRQPEITGEATITSLGGTSSTGMSSDTLLFDATYREPAGKTRTEHLVARVAPSPGDVPVFPHYDLTTQFLLLRHVGANSDVPVPRVRWDEPDPSVLGSPFFVMDRVDGVVPPDVLPYTFGDNWLHDATADQQRHLQDRTVDVIAALHALDATHPDLTRLHFSDPGATVIARHIAHTKAWYEFARRDGIRSQLIEGAFEWLDDHPPQGDGTVLSWGDSRIGNVMYRDFEPVAVLDWEMACLGPRELDVAWLLYAHMVFEEIAHVFELDGMPHFLRPDDVLTRYEHDTGHACADLDPYLTLAAIKFGIAFLRTGTRQAHFGEITLPDDHDELLHNRPGLTTMLSAGTWRLT